MRFVARAAVLGLVLIGTGAPVRAADPSDPDWPCVQRKVDRLSLAALWPHPVPEGASLPPGLEDVAARLALRRVSEEEARALLAGVAADHPDLGPEGYGLLFRATFDHIDRQRAQVLAGIGRYARNQAGLAGRIDGLRAEMARLEAADPPDFDRLDAVEEEVDWSTRIFGDRSRALTYVCESPVLLEQRAYALARMMLEQAG